MASGASSPAEAIWKASGMRKDGVVLFGSEPDRAQLNLLAKNVTKLEELNFVFEAKIESMGDEKDQIIVLRSREAKEKLSVSTTAQSKAKVALSHVKLHLKDFSQAKQVACLYRWGPHDQTGNCYMWKEA